MKKAIDWLMKAISFAIGLLLFLAVIMVFVQVVSRYVLRAPLGWTDQFCRFLYIWIIMLGLPVLFHNKSMTAFDFLSNKLGQRQQRVLKIFICVLSLFFAACFFFFSLKFMEKKGGMMIPAFKVIPYYAVYASMPISACFLFIEVLLQLTEAIKELAKGKGGAEEC